MPEIDRHRVLFLAFSRSSQRQKASSSFLWRAQLLPRPPILPLSPMATLLSAQMVQRSERALGTGHGRGRSQELLSPFGATAPAPGSGMMVTSHKRHYS